MTDTPDKGRGSGITVLVVFGIAILTFAATLFVTWQMMGTPSDQAPTSVVQTADAEPSVVETEPEG